VELSRGRRLFLWTLVASLVATGLLAIGTLLVAEFDGRAGRILGTTALLALASLLSLPAGVLLDRRRLVALAWATIGAAAAGFALAVVTIWARPDEWVSQLTWTVWLGAGAGAQACVVTGWARREDSRRLRALLVLSLALAAALAALVAVTIWEEPDSDLYFRALGAIAVAAVLTTLLQPILRRVEAPAGRPRELVLELDREPSEEAVAAAVETLAQHGIRAERR
jgi:MFS family permease